MKVFQVKLDVDGYRSLLPRDPEVARSRLLALRGKETSSSFSAGSLGNRIHPHRTQPTSARLYRTESRPPRRFRVTTQPRPAPQQATPPSTGHPHPRLHTVVGARRLSIPRARGKDWLVAGGVEPSRRRRSGGGQGPRGVQAAWHMGHQLGAVRRHTGRHRPGASQCRGTAAPCGCSRRYPRGGRSDGLLVALDCAVSGSTTLREALRLIEEWRREDRKF
jgi:hypothetical protein